MSFTFQSQILKLSAGVVRIEARGGRPRVAEEGALVELADVPRLPRAGAEHAEGPLTRCAAELAEVGAATAAQTGAKLCGRVRDIWQTTK